MRKFICALLVTFTSLMNADCLFDAINKHDLKKVTLLLKQKQYDSTSNILYINAAHEMVEQCRDKMLIQSLKPGMDPIFAVAGVICLLGSFYPIYQMCNMQLDFQLTGKQIDGIKLEIAKIIGINFVTGLCFGIAMVIYEGEVEDAYHEAVKIQQLIAQLPYV